jgi:hypothetical protein
MHHPIGRRELATNVQMTFPISNQESEPDEVVIRFEDESSNILAYEVTIPASQLHVLLRGGMVRGTGKVPSPEVVARIGMVMEHGSLHLGDPSGPRLTEEEAQAAARRWGQQERWDNVTAIPQRGGRWRLLGRRWVPPVE